MDKQNPTSYRVKQVDRNQLKLKVVDLENVIPAGHSARSIWEFIGRQDLSMFYEEIKTVEGVAGREHWDPRMMITVWLYAISQGISSAREISRRCEYEPAFMWITGDKVINHHSLSDFRVGHGEALRRLFIDVLGAMSMQGLVTIKRVMQDGTKIEAAASSNSFRREGTLLKHLEIAREAVKRMEENADESVGKKTRKRREVSAKERLQRLEKAYQELEKMRAEKKSEEEKEKTRVSLSDPESRVMREGNGGFDPCFNAQILTDAENKIIVGVSLTQDCNDIHQLEDSLFEIDRNTGKTPGEMVVDSGYISADNIDKMIGAGINLYGPMPDNKSKAKRKSEIAPEFYSEKFNLRCGN
jgi:transposase